MNARRQPFETINKIVDPILRDLSGELNTDILVDPTTLAEIESYIENDFNRENATALRSPDIFRVAALYVYWIARLQPARQIDFAKEDFKIHRYLNEYLALQVGLSLVSMERPLRNTDVDEKAFKDAVFGLRHGQTSKETAYWMLHALIPARHPH